jgi:hypothetical protein
LTIVASSTTMNCATQTITRTSQRFVFDLVLIVGILSLNAGRGWSGIRGV